MRITLTERFQKDIPALPESSKAQVFSTILKIPVAVKDIHRHSGIGIRKIHPSGIFEARVGLGLRIVFGYDEDVLVLHRVGSHDDIQRYLRGL